MAKKLPLMELRVNPKKGIHVSAIALVGKPAIESNFLKFSEDQLKERFAINEEKRELLGAAMIPGLPMYRNNKDLGEFMSVFHANTIRQIAQHFAQAGFNNSLNINHTNEDAGCYVYQSYIVDTKRGILPPKGIEAPDGSWIIGVKVDSDSTWQSIKSGDSNGFSVEGFFEHLNTNLHIEFEKEDTLLASFEDALTEYQAEPKGCLMFFPEVDQKAWDLNLMRLAPGAMELEHEPHVTILYGIDDTPDIIDLLKGFLQTVLPDYPIEIATSGLSRFTGGEQDVLKIDIQDLNGCLTMLNEVLTAQLEVISDYPVYQPHMTLAYVTPEPDTVYSGSEVWDWEFGITSLNRGKIIYSDPNKVQTVLITIK